MKRFAQSTHFTHGSLTKRLCNKSPFLLIIALKDDENPQYK